MEIANYFTRPRFPENAKSGSKGNSPNAGVRNEQGAGVRASGSPAKVNAVDSSDG